MVAGIFLSIKDGLRFVLCNLLKLSKLDFKLSQAQTSFMMVLSIASLKLLEIKDHWHYIKVRPSFKSGSLTPFIGVGILGSVRFGLYENAKTFLAKQKNL